METEYLLLQHGNIKYYQCRLTAQELIAISYVARRGEVDEQGAVQRILNKRRVGGIAEFLLNGGYFQTNFILNIVKNENVTVNDKSLTIQEGEKIAQVLDGQHRLEGLKEAIKKKPELGNLMFPVLITIGLQTEECAEIFLNINTEQKPVSRSLIYDLYGVVNIPNRDVSIDRGKDLSVILNENEDSPYCGYIKFPGSNRFRGGIQLSSVISKLKPLVKPRGEFEKYGVSELESQSKILINYFNAIKYFYGAKWDEISTNPFLYMMGFSAALDLLQIKLLPKCNVKRSYTKDTFKSLLNLPVDKLPKRSEYKGLSGERAREDLYNYLCDHLTEDKDAYGDIEL